MVKFVHKSIYLEYLTCPKNAWLKLHKKDELQDFFALSDFEQGLFDKGNLAESWAQKIFPNGILIEKHGRDAALLTKQHVEQKTAVLFQATFIHDNFLVRNDVLQYNDISGKWNLFEIKGKNSLTENRNEIDHIEDATFQAIVLKKQGIELEDVFIIHLNENYVRLGDVDVSKLFIIKNITEKVQERTPRTKKRMQKAKFDLLLNNQEALSCICMYKGRSSHCKTFGHSYSFLPTISVHDIARISQKKLTTLINSSIVSIGDIPQNFELTKIQNNQVVTYKSQKALVDPEAIKRELNRLVYPLYFLDYETYASPIPLFDGFKPYQPFPFQFSMYIQITKDSEPSYFEYLHETDSDPSKKIIEKLKELIGPVGNIIIWHKSFEQTINIKLGESYPEYKEFLHNLNTRCFDLEEIFKKQYYIHPKFNGKTSIKNILPVLVSDLSYDKFEIQEGGDASERWFKMIEKNLSETEKLKIAEDLKQYCCLDTYAMYKILQHLLLLR